MLEQQLLTFALLGVEWVLWLLVGLSLICVAIAVERVIVHALDRTDSSSLHQSLAAFFAEGDAGKLLGALKALKGVEARVLAAGLEAAEAGGTDAADAAMAGHVTFERLKMERGLIVIGTVGSNAPFIGLFGTVLGIIQAFHQLSLETDEAAANVMAGISEALVATAVGLMVAIPAVVLYNYFQRRNKEVVGRLESTGHLLVSRLSADSDRMHSNG